MNRRQIDKANAKVAMKASTEATSAANKLQMAWNPMRKKALAIVLVALSTLLAGCPSDPDNPLGLVEPTETGDQSFRSQGLTGRIVTSNDRLPFEINLSTGEGRFLEVSTVQDELETFDDSQSILNAYFTGTADGGFVQSGDTCFRNGFGASPASDGCLMVYNADLERVKSTRLVGSLIGGGAKLSRSGKFLAFSYYLDGFRGAARTAVVNVETMERVNTFRNEEPIGFGSSKPPVFTWGPDDQLIFSEAAEDGLAKINIVNPFTTEIETTINVPENLRDQRIRSLDLSPDGSKVVFQIGDGIQVLDLATLNLTVPAIADVGTLEGPRWSPDGKMLMFLNQSAGAGPVFDINFQATVIAGTKALYAVSADRSTPAVIGGGTLDGAVLVRFILPDSDGRISTRFPGDALFDVAYFDWLPQ